MSKRLTYGILKKKLARLTDKQLRQPIRIIGEEKGFYIDAIVVEKEDWVAPDGDPEFAEPISVWRTHPEENKGLGHPKKVIRKNDVILYIKE